jgi:transposase-like protein/IS1 family transposase
MTCHYCKATAKKFGKYGAKKIQRYRCLECGKTFSEDQEKPLEDMRIDLDKALQVINLLVEGVGINAASRLADIDKKTVLKILALAGERCAAIMDTKLRNLPLVDIQCDEIWGFVEKKERHVRPTDNALIVGDQFTFVAIDRDTKLVISYAVGKRTAPMTRLFMDDLAERLTERPQISTDSFGAYRHAIRKSFNHEVDHGQIVKVYAKGTSEERRYSPPEVTAAIKTAITGEPRKENICTSHVERSNLTMRTFMRRLTRLCLGFSKKLENLKYAVALYFAWYNFCRVHSSLKETPAMAAGISNHVWNLGELIA